MRALFLLLVLANLIFFAYAHVAGDGATIGNRIAALQISPDRIRLLRSVGGPVEAARQSRESIPPVVAPKAPSACLEWSNLNGPDIARAENDLAQMGIEPARIERVVAEADGYWVHMPPLANKAEVDRKIGELKALGVHEYFVVQEAGQWRNAISLGIFRSDEAANVFLASLRERGVRSAVKSRREKLLKQVVFYVREPGDALVAKLAEIQRDYPGTEIKARPCPPPSAPPKG